MAFFYTQNTNGSDRPIIEMKIGIIERSIFFAGVIFNLSIIKKTIK